MRPRQTDMRSDTLDLQFSDQHVVIKGTVPSLSALEADFPSVDVSLIAEQESWRKEVQRPASHTHKWWAQRLGSVFRAILTSATTTDAEAASSGYAQGMSLEGLTVLDPFAGSGTTLVEAAKLGANVIGMDINPVAALVERQALQRWDVKELQHGYQLVESKCRQEIDRLHRTKSGETVLYYFWVALANCPECRAYVRLFSSHVFAQHAYPKRYPKAQAVCPTCLSIQTTRYDVEKLECVNGHFFEKAGAVYRANMTCPQGHTSRIIDALKGHPPKHEMYAKLVLGGGGDKRYEAIDGFDHELYEEAVALLDQKRSALVLPEGGLEEGYNTRQAMRWGYRSWTDFFNERQLYNLGLLGAAVRDLEIGAPEREALSTLFSGTLEFNNLFCSFKGEGTGAVRHMFSHHILKPERMVLEAHPWGTPASSGSFSTLYRSRLLRAYDYKIAPTDQIMREGSVVRVGGISRRLELKVDDRWNEPSIDSDQWAYVRSGDGASTDIPDSSVDLIITDPPYMDNVHYSELADFFHAWLRSVRPYAGYPSDLMSTRQTGEVQSTSPDGFEEAIGQVWSECARVMRPGGLLAFTFHQARITGWIALSRALLKSGLIITAVQPIKAEMSTSVTKAGADEPSNLDSVIVCRKQGHGEPFAATPDDAGRRAFDALKRLKDGGVQVGVTDARSVVRGCVLSLITDPHQRQGPEKLAQEADVIASQVIADLSLGTESL